MFMCPICKATKKNRLQLSDHFRLHGSNIQRCDCPVKNCWRSFKTLKVYMDHVTKSHLNTEKDTKVSTDLLNNKITVNDKLNYTSDGQVNQHSTPINTTCSDKNTQVKSTYYDDDNDNNELFFETKTPLFDEMLSSFQKTQFSKAEDLITELYADPLLPRNLVQKISLKFQEFYHRSIDDLRKCLEHVFTDQEKVNIGISILKKSFSQLNTDHNVIASLKNRGVLIEPQKKLIQTSLQLRKTSLRKSYKKVEMNIIIVPMKDTLKQFLELPNVFQTIKKYIDDKNTELLSSPSIVSSMLHGENWKKIKSQYPDKLVLPLSVYTDDYEINNPLGSRKRIQKMTGIYYSISCLPGEFAGQLKNWFLAQKHKQQDYNYHNKSANRKFFNNLIQELKDLQKNGISITVDGQKYHVFFHLAQLLGDNLALNQILGFQASFNANYYCRICRESKKNCCQRIQEVKKSLRTEQNYLKDVATSSHGVQEKSVFFEVFNMFESPTMDPFHDKEEGGFRYVMGQVLYDLIQQKKYFTIDYLNKKISGFNIDKSSGVNIPPPINTKQLKKKYLILSGSEMSWLVMNLSILVGHLIGDPEDETWKLYILTRKINYIIMSSSYNKDTTPNELTILIKKHHSLYLQLFNTHLVPKLHFWLHVPRSMIQHGLIRGLSTIRGEAKHRFFKQVAKSITSRKLPAYTLSLKHQMQWANRILKQESILNNIVLGVKKPVYLNKINEWPQFKDCTPTKLENHHNIYSWVKYDGILYKPEMTVCIEHIDSNLPIFGKIKYIIESENIIYFVLKKFITIKFDEHIQAFYVEKSQSWQWSMRKNFATHITYSPQILPSKEIVISKMYH